MRKGKKIGMGIGIAFAVFIALVAIGYSVSQTGAQTQSELKGADRQSKIATILGNDESRMNDAQWQELANSVIDTENTNNALLLIASNTNWQGAKQGSDFVQESVEGSGFARYEIECEYNGIYSISFQKGTDTGTLNLYVAYDGRIIKQGGTTAQYGVVSLAGTCT